MSATIALILGVVQGLTEFLPVSSSGHLAIAAMLFGEPDLSLATVVFLHAGTLLATLALFGGDVGRLVLDAGRGLRAPREWLTSDSGKTTVGLVVATVPTALVGLALRHRVEALSHVAWAVGLGFLASAVAALSTRLARGQRPHLGLGGYVLVGLAQGLAVMPGLSRSGSTIAAALLLGMAPAEAFRFSFLLSIPAIVGALLLEGIGTPGGGGIGVAAWMGGAAALVVGYAALLALRRVVVQGRFWVFALYLIPLGAGVVLWGLST